MSGFERVTLKVCEGCGTLWVRRGVAGVYCEPCARLLEQFPDPRTRLRPGRPKKARSAASEAGLVGGFVSAEMLAAAGGVQ